MRRSFRTSTGAGRRTLNTRHSVVLAPSRRNRRFIARMIGFTHQLVNVGDETRIAAAFCAEHGAPPNGLITDAQFDAIYDQLVTVLKKFGTFSEGGGDGDFSSSRYVDQCPWIRVVVEDHIDPSISVKAGLEAVRTSTIPFALAFDYYPNLILVLPPARVFSTYDERALQSA
jgi:hypothetical protein